MSHRQRSHLEKGKEKEKDKEGDSVDRGCVQTDVAA